MYHRPMPDPRAHQQAHEPTKAANPPHQMMPGCGNPFGHETWSRHRMREPQDGLDQGANKPPANLKRPIKQALADCPRSIVWRAPLPARRRDASCWVAARCWRSGDRLTWETHKVTPTEQAHGMNQVAVRVGADDGEIRSLKTDEEKHPSLGSARGLAHSGKVR